MRKFPLMTNDEIRVRRSIINDRIRELERQIAVERQQLKVGGHRG
jgi:hypothetical protein